MIQERAVGAIETTTAATTITTARAARWLWGAALLGLGALLGATLSQRSPGPSGGGNQTAASGTPQQAVQALARTRSPQASGSADLRYKLLEAMARPEPASTPPSDDPHVAEPSQVELLDSVRLQPRDEAWASATQVTLEQDLAPLAAQLKFRIGEVACRTSGCVAELEWPSAVQAQRDFKAVVGANTYRLDCHRRLLLPGADSPSGRAQLIVNCNRQPRTKTP